MQKILLSAVGGMPSVSYIKHLKSQGYFVIGIDSNPNSVGFSFCDQYHVSPLVSQEVEYLAFIQSLDFDVFFPWLDEEHLLFSKIDINAIFQNKKIVTSPSNSIVLSTNKELMYDFCVENGINTAKKVSGAPAFVRRLFSRGGKGARLISNEEELAKIDKSNYIFQEYIVGDEFTVDVLSLPDFFFAVPRQRVHATNVSTEGKIIMNEKIISFCREICKKIIFFGPINIQIFRLPDGKLSLIEINPRLAGTAILSMYAGFDLLDLTCKYIKHEKVESPYLIREYTMRRFYCEEYI